MKNKRVLVIYYSQTGQMREIVHHFIAPLEGQVDVRVCELRSREEFGFPWSFWKFFDTFPESVYLDPPLNEPLPHDLIASYDLIILGYQPWFLSPSLPMSAFMNSDEARILLENKPIITLIGCRNMWIEGQKVMKELIHNVGGRLIDNVVLRDQSGPLESFITTPRWMLTGKRDPFWGFSSAGIASHEIAATRRFGEAILEGLREGKEGESISMLQGLGAVQVDPRFIASEKIGKRSFRIWGKLVRLLGKRGDPKRRIVLSVYIVFLLVLIVTVVPVNMALQTIFRRVFKGKIDRIIREIAMPSGE